MDRTILAIDLGAKTGWCILFSYGKDRVVGGTEEFPGDRHERLRAFHVWLHKMVRDYDPSVVAYERPFARGLAATRSLWGMSGITEAVAGDSAAVLDVNTQTLKAWARAETGIGPASDKKAATTAVATQRLGHAPVDDNHADAVCLAFYVREKMRIDK